MLNVQLNCTDRAIELGLRDWLTFFLPEVLAELMFTLKDDQFSPENIFVSYGSGEEWSSPKGDDFQAVISPVGDDLFMHMVASFLILVNLRLRSELPPGFVGRVSLNFDRRPA